MRVAVSWSSGKDSAWMLHIVREEHPDWDVVCLLTTTNEAFDRVAMHGVRRDVLEAQAEAVGVPLRVVPLPWPCSNEDYEARMARAFEALVAEGVEAVAFGDLFLEDVRDYRVRQLDGTGLTPVFPLWGRPTAALSIAMVAAGARATITCADPRKVPETYAGRAWHDLLQHLPDGVDPCGEYGEFHSLATDGPAFAYPLAIEVGQRQLRDGFAFAEVTLRS